MAAILPFNDCATPIFWLMTTKEVYNTCLKILRLSSYAYILASTVCHCCQAWSRPTTKAHLIIPVPDCQC